MFPIATKGDVLGLLVSGFLSPWLAEQTAVDERQLNDDGTRKP